MDDKLSLENAVERLRGMVLKLDDSGVSPAMGLDSAMCFRVISLVIHEMLDLLFNEELVATMARSEGSTHTAEKIRVIRDGLGHLEEIIQAVLKKWE